jgi:hypothetical protein
MSVGLRVMDPARVFARWIQARFHRQQRMPEPRTESWRGEDTPSSRTALECSFVVLGWLNDGADLAHVLYRNDRNIPGSPATAGAQHKSEAEQEEELKRIMCVRTFPFTVLCRRQQNGSGKLIASRELYFLPSVALIIDAG